MTNQETKTGGETNAMNATRCETAKNASSTATSKLNGTGVKPRSKAKKSKAKKAKVTAKSETKATLAKSGINKTKATKEKLRSNTSALDAAATVLKNSKKPMRCKEIVEVMIEQKLGSTDGKTPAATLSTAMTMLPKAG